MNFHSHRTLVFALSLLATQSTLANTEWIGVECTYTPSDESEMKETIKETETNSAAISSSTGKSTVTGSSAGTSASSGTASASSGTTGAAGASAGTGTATSSSIEKSTITENNLYEIKHKFFINEYSQYVKDVDKNDIRGAIFENDKIHIKIGSEHGSYKIILSRNGYTSSSLFIQSEANTPSHYTGKCHSITLQNDDVFPNQAYPSTNRGF